MFAKSLASQNFSVRDVDFSPIFRLNLRKNRFVSFSETLKNAQLKTARHSVENTGAVFNWVART